MIGTDLPALLPDAVREIEDPFSGERVLACRALRPDVCLLHAHRADAKGNVQYRQGTIWPDVQSFPKAAARTIVSVEEVVSEAEVRRRPHETVIPHFAVDAVVEAPHGCHPTSFFPDYTYDQAFHRDMHEAAGVGRLWELEQRYSGHLDRLRRLHLPEAGKAERILDDHQRLLDAIVAQDPQRAQQVLREHLSGTLSQVAEICKRYPEYVLTA